jgi:hypothetical protein
LITHRVTTVLCAGLLTTVVVGSAALTPPAAQAARTSNVEKFALKETTFACKAQAKQKKIRWPASRKYLNDCVAKPFKLTPAGFQKIAFRRATVACKAEAKGKKIRWPASRTYVKNCITTVLKDHPTTNIAELHRLVNVKTLRVHQPSEWGCGGLYAGGATGC